MAKITCPDCYGNGSLFRGQNDVKIGMGGRYDVRTRIPCDRCEETGEIESLAPEVSSLEDRVAALEEQCAVMADIIKRFFAPLCAADTTPTAPTKED
jgi:hypothetical protein